MHYEKKYVVIETGRFEELVVFQPTLEHRYFRNLPGKIVSAGFVGASSRTRSGYSAHGKSASLGIESRPEDQILLDHLLCTKDLDD